jgi:VanZ family protein
MTDQTPQNRFRIQSRAVLWGLIVLYTLLIPNAIFVYRFIEARFGLVFAGKIPLVVVTLLGFGYVVYLYRAKLGWKKVMYLVPCVVIALAIFRLEGNPNKHIHIPEYILMAWLVYAALEKDYRGKGILILVFILASMLGVVDELEQGIHPGRTYGWTDMLVNTSSALMGIFTILGLTNYHAIGGWEWIGSLKKFISLIGLILFGSTGAVIMCVNLFSVQAAKSVFHGVYPVWMLVWNVLFLVITALILFFQRDDIFTGQRLPGTSGEQSVATARLWFIPPITILFFMHALVIFVAISGLAFK